MSHIPSLQHDRHANRSSHSFRRCLMSATVIASVTVSLCTATVAGAQPGDIRKTASLTGLSGAEVTARFGDPDTVVRNEVNEQERWSYGPSSVFLAKGKVTGWLDQGELSAREQRQKLAREKTPDNKSGDPFDDGWVNPWTPRKSVPKPDIVPDILKEDLEDER